MPIKVGTTLLIKVSRRKGEIMSLYILLMLFGGLMGFVITDEWIIRPLKRKNKHLEKEYKGLLQESLDLINK